MMIWTSCRLSPKGTIQRFLRQRAKITVPTMHSHVNVTEPLFGTPLDATQRILPIRHWQSMIFVDSAAIFQLWKLLF
jgi:hypothetical protein